jgi:lysophospholipase L1-like esterase
MSIQKDDKAVGPKEAEGDQLTWHVPSEPPFRLAGFAWFQHDRAYRRLPVTPKWPLPEAVDNLANCTAGGQIQFQTNSRKVAVRVRLAAPASMDHMPQTGSAGFDCYLGRPKRQRYWSTTRFPFGADSYTCSLLDLPERAKRSVTLNFPLYQGVKEVLVGMEPDARVQAPPPYEDDRLIVVYGTSITQGGCAARPGMAFTNILSLRLNRPFVNLGFSGSGRGEPEVARTIAEIPNPACFLLDYEGNAGGGQLERTLNAFINILREAHLETPILVVSMIRMARDHFSPVEAREREERRDFQHRTVEEQRAAGDANIHFMDGGGLLGRDFDECTVDGVHPTDLGFWRMAKALEPVLKGILGA